MVGEHLSLSRTSYRFERFELRPTERVLYLEGVPTNLGARAVDVLTVLVSEGGRLVSKSELLDRVWPNLVVEENNLQVQISSLRKLLGAAAIATVPGRGYRFCLPIEVEGESAGVTSPLGGRVRGPGRRRRCCRCCRPCRGLSGGERPTWSPSMPCCRPR